MNVPNIYNRKSLGIFIDTIAISFVSLVRIMHLFPKC